MNKKEDLRVRKTKKNLYEALLTIMKEKSLECIYRGSKNQRLIDVPKSLAQKEVVLYDIWIE